MLLGIAILFGLGNVFDSMVSLGAYIFLLKKNKVHTELCNLTY